MLSTLIVYSFYFSFEQFVGHRMKRGYCAFEFVPSLEGQGRARREVQWGRWGKGVSKGQGDWQLAQTAQ